MGATGGLVPVSTPVPWSRFVEAVRSSVAETYPCSDPTDKAAREGAKKQMLAFVPARFDAGETRRLAANVRGSTIIGCDFDGVPPEAWAEALKRCKTIAAVAHTSPTDGLTPGVRKGRVYALLDREATPAEIWTLRCGLAQGLGLRPWLDEATKDASRIFFAGRIDGTSEREFLTFDGPPVPADGLLALLPQGVATVAGSENEASGVHERADVRAERARVAEHIRAIVEPHMVATGHRHKIARGLGGLLGRANWNDEEIAELLRELPSTDVERRVADALGAAAQARRAIGRRACRR